MKDFGKPNNNFGLEDKPKLRDIGKLGVLVAAALAGTLLGALFTRGRSNRP